MQDLDPAKTVIHKPKGAIIITDRGDKNVRLPIKEKTSRTS